MKFLVNNNKYNILALSRLIGYHPHRNNKSFSRRLSSGEFPRFHIYTKELESGLEFSLHLDQKGACHTGQTAHSGDYDGQVLETEKERIINLLKD
ncbi:MAG: hypothetical protein HOC78_03460 [Candidatus Komeilibacteria bacterium]|jgi:hypothetical protein|nr:hypothetical protein [Candidatus Komeilibacteria bacterium]